MAHPPHFTHGTHLQTTAIDLSVASVPVAGAAVPTKVELYLMDTPGASIFNMRDEGTKQWETANMVAVVFDVGAKESFAAAAKWLRRFLDARAAADAHGARPLLGACPAAWRGGWRRAPHRRRPLPLTSAACRRAHR